MEYKDIGRLENINTLSCLLLWLQIWIYDLYRFILRLVCYKWFLWRKQELVVVFEIKRESRAYERYTRDNSSDSARILVILLRSRTRCSITEKLSPRSARGHAWSSRICFWHVPAVFRSWSFDQFVAQKCHWNYIRALFVLEIIRQDLKPRYIYIYVLHGHFGV